MSEEIHFGSVCSGIEAASVAWNSIGWTALWFSEIEPFPCEILRQRFPDVPNLGDMTSIPDRILSGEVRAPDVLCGGTPCQSFSVAGKRKSLDDDRGNLALIFTEIADAIDIVRVRSGRQESIIFWENVPGVLNTKDNAFGCFLGQLVGAEFPLSPGAEGSKWPGAGFATGPKRSVAWRTLDAQFFGVPQRRRRVFVVASARNDINLAETLFEQTIVRRDSPQGGKEGQTTSARVGNSTTVSRDKGFLKVYDAPHNYSHIGEHDTCPTLISRAGTGGGNVPLVVHENVSATGVNGVLPPPDKNYAPAFSIAENLIGRKLENGCNGIGIAKEKCYTLNATGVHGVAKGLVVRRLTPVECERLQGFPDNWTQIPWKGKTKEECPDSHRYKAIGNSWPVPVVEFIGRKINEQFKNSRWRKKNNAQ